jgi:signal transduction histidine kinase
MVMPIIAVSTLPLVVGILAAWRVHSSQKHASDSLARNVVGIRAGEELAIGIRDVRTQLNHFLATGNHEYLDAVPSIRQAMDPWLSEAERVAVTERERELVGRMKAGYRYFFRELDRLTKQSPPPEEFAAQVRALNNGPLTQEILEPAQQYLDETEIELTQSNADNERMADQVVLGLLLLGICGTASGLVAGFGIARGVSRSIVRLSVPIRDAAGKLNEVVGPLTVSAGADLEEMEQTLHKMAGQIGDVVARLQESRREVLRAEQLAAVGQMAAGIAHEVRNPLMAIKILIQAAGERSPVAVLDGRDLTVLEEEITRLERSIQTFLDFARPPQLEKRTFAISDLVTQIVALVSGRAKRQGVQIETDLPPEGSIVIHADMGQVRQVLLNLLLNALDATPEGGMIEIRVRIDTDPSLQLAIAVADTGPGLPAELGPKIFEPFVSTKVTGIGLGLSICKRILEAHEGEIVAANRPEGGAVFTVFLPLAMPQSRQQSAFSDQPNQSQLLTAES